MKKLILSGTAAVLLLVPALCGASGVTGDMTLCGTDYTLPIPMAELLGDGWDTAQQDDVLSPDSYTVDERFSRSGMTFAGSVINLGLDDLTEAQCFLGQITVTAEDAARGTTALVGGVGIGDTRDAVLTCWGNPAAIDAPDEDTTVVTYEGEGYDKLTFTFTGDVVTALSLRRFTAPAGYLAQSEVDATLPPEDAYAYDAPDSLGDAPAPGMIALSGIPVRLPVPVSVLAGYGWTLHGGDTVLAARDTLWDGVLTDGVHSFAVSVTNASPVATTAENGLITGIGGAGDQLALPGGLGVGAPMSAVEHALADCPWEADEENGRVVYTLDFSMEASVSIVVDEATGLVCGLNVLAMPEGR